VSLQQRGGTRGGAGDEARGAVHAVVAVRKRQRETVRLQVLHDADFVCICSAFRF